MSKRITKIIRKLEEELNKGNRDIKFEKYDIQISLSNENLTMLICKSISYEELYYIYQYLINRGYEINFVINNLTNIFSRYNIGLTDIDYSYLNKLYKFTKQNNLNTEIAIIDGNFSTIPYEDYINLLDCLKWYRKIINDSNLSPLEKVIFAYDICKTFEYSDDVCDNTDSTYKANTLYLIIKTGKIVCLGYNVLAQAILAGLDDNIRFSPIALRHTESHVRGIVKIDDDKYNIHGLYFLDPTWDSIQEDYKDIYGKKYDALSAYRYFLVPFSKYNSYFNGDAKPTIFLFWDVKVKKEYLDDKKLEKLYKKLDGKKDIYYNLVYDFQKLLDEEITFKEFYNYLNCERPKLNVMANAITNVRLAEGYNLEDMDSLVFGINSNRKDKEYILNKKNLKKINK